MQKAHCRCSHSERNVPNAWVPPLACFASGFLTQETGSWDSHIMTPYSMLIHDKRCCIRDSTDETQRENKKDIKKKKKKEIYIQVCTHTGGLIRGRICLPTRPPSNRVRYLSSHLSRANKNTVFTTGHDMLPLQVPN